jgi:nucleotide-binding universal stress UspA family protein
MPDRPVLLCYDASEDAKHAISEAGRLFGPGPALVLSVWQDARAIPSFAWAAPMDFGELLEAARQGADRVAAEGAQAAEAAGFTATPLVVESLGPVWQRIVAVATERDVEAIALGSRGLSGVKAALIGSVSSAVVQHATCPTLVVHRPEA